MPNKSEFAAHCTELLNPLGPTRTGRMFSGHGYYVDDLFIALSIADRLYLKTDAQTRERFEAAGCEPFTYEAAGGKRVSISYWSAPEDAMESPMLMLPWVRLAMEAALRARNTKPATKKRKPKQARGGTKS